MGARTSAPSTTPSAKPATGFQTRRRLKKPKASSADARRRRRPAIPECAILRPGAVASSFRNKYWADQAWAATWRQNRAAISKWSSSARVGNTQAFTTSYMARGSISYQNINGKAVEIHQRGATFVLEKIPGASPGYRVYTGFPAT